ncbi:MAG: hypothetical protein ACI9XP_000719 [Lentimonas sp.]|jgi:hypothetical protein
MLKKLAELINYRIFALAKQGVSDTKCLAQF